MLFVKYKACSRNQRTHTCNYYAKRQRPGNCIGYARAVADMFLARQCKASQAAQSFELGDNKIQLKETRRWL